MRKLSLLVLFFTSVLFADEKLEQLKLEIEKQKLELEVLKLKNQQVQPQQQSKPVSTKTEYQSPQQPFYKKSKSNFYISIGHSIIENMDMTGQIQVSTEVTASANGYSESETNSDSSELSSNLFNFDSVTELDFGYKKDNFRIGFSYGQINNPVFGDGSESIDYKMNYQIAYFDYLFNIPENKKIKLFAGVLAGLLNVTTDFSSINSDIEDSLSYYCDSYYYDDLNCEYSGFEETSESGFGYGFRAGFEYDITDTVYFGAKYQIFFVEVVNDNEFKMEISGTDTIYSYTDSYPYYTHQEVNYNRNITENIQTTHKDLSIFNIYLGINF